MKKMADSREGQQAIEANKSHIDIFVPLPPIASWKMIERISLNIGRKHYCATSVEDLLGLDRVRAGDRVVVTMAKDDFEQERRQAAESGRGSSIEGKIKSLRNAGAMVEVQEILFLIGCSCHCHDGIILLLLFGIQFFFTCGRSTRSRSPARRRI
jgi:hypothetical protein